MKPLARSIASIPARLLADGIADGAHGAGRVPFSLDPQRLGLPAGRYAISLETDAGEYPQAEINGRVDNVRVSAEGPVLQVQGVGQVPFYNILEFAQAYAGLLGG